MMPDMARDISAMKTTPPQTRLHTYIHPSTHTPTHPQTYTHIHLHTRLQTHIYTHIHALIDTHTHTPADSLTTYTDTYSYSHGKQTKTSQPDRQTANKLVKKKTHKETDR